MEKSPAKRYRGPGIGGTLGIVLALVALGLQLGNVQDPTAATILYIAAGAVLVLAALWAGWIRIVPRIKRRVVAWLQREIVQPALEAERTSSSQSVRHTLALNEAQERIAERRAKLRLALNQALEEVEYINGRVISNDSHYWRLNDLPINRWEEHGGFIATEDDDAHAALREAYRVRDAIQHSVNRQRLTGSPNTTVTVYPPEGNAWRAAYDRARTVVGDSLKRLRDSANGAGG